MRIAGAALAIAVLASARIAAGDPDPNIVRADAMFDEAQKLLDAGHLEAACAKFDESLKLNGQAIGTLMNVARCDARLGKLAHAVALFSEARDRAHEQGLAAYVTAADEQLAKLSPLVPHLALALAEEPVGMKIVIDTQALTPSAAADLALDPGAHQVTVSAPGRVTYEMWVKLGKSEHKALAVPALAYPTTVHPTHSSRRAIGKIVTAGGGAIALAGLAVGIVARSHYNDALDHDCNGAEHCSPDGFAKTQSARSLGNVGTVLGISGLAIGAAGLVVWMTAPHDVVERGVSFAPLVGPTEAGVVAVGHF